MNYQPFNLVPPGAFFTRLDEGSQTWMKTIPVGNGCNAVAMESSWVNKRLIPRGFQSQILGNECVILILDGDSAVIELSIAPGVPRDPDRAYWDAETVVQVGKISPISVPAFAGLFAYSGAGMGNYYSSSGERIWDQVDDARAKSQAECVPFVYVDLEKGLTLEALAVKRNEAQACHDQRQPATAEA